MYDLRFTIGEEVVVVGQKTQPQASISQYNNQASAHRISYIVYRISL